MGIETIPAVALCVFLRASNAQRRTGAPLNCYSFSSYAKLVLMASGHCLAVTVFLYRSPDGPFLAEFACEGLKSSVRSRSMSLQQCQGAQSGLVRNFPWKTPCGSLSRMRGKLSRPVLRALPDCGRLGDHRKAMKSEPIASPQQPQMSFLRQSTTGCRAFWTRKITTSGCRRASNQASGCYNVSSLTQQRQWKDTQSPRWSINLRTIYPIVLTRWGQHDRNLLEHKRRPRFGIHPSSS